MSVCQSEKCSRSPRHRGKLFLGSWNNQRIAWRTSYQSVRNEVETSRPRDAFPEVGSQITCSGRCTMKKKVRRHLSLRNTHSLTPVGDSQCRVYVVHTSRDCQRLLFKLNRQFPSWDPQSSWPAPRHPWRPVSLKPHCMSESPGVLVKTNYWGHPSPEFLIEEVLEVRVRT